MSGLIGGIFHIHILATGYSLGRRSMIRDGVGELLAHTPKLEEDGGSAVFGSMVGFTLTTEAAF
jgi:hypothetical protein